MEKIKEVLEKSGFPAVRLVWKSKPGEKKPETYYTYQRMAWTPKVNADDEAKEEVENWLVRIITKKNFEQLIEDTVKGLREAGYGVASVDQEVYEPETGYWLVPISVENIKE